MPGPIIPPVTVLQPAGLVMRPLRVGQVRRDRGQHPFDRRGAIALQFREVGVGHRTTTGIKPAS